MTVVRTCSAVIAVLVLMSVRAVVAAGTVEVRVMDRDGDPVPDVAVFLEAAGRFAPAAPPGTTAVMDQYDKRFVPHLLVVQSGTSVEFPNSDTIAHHVYSFSHPNAFKLPIYKGQAHPPVTFEESGVVILGCNIHDNMLGYILVVDSPRFAKTDEHGLVSLVTDFDGDARVSVWSPRIRDDVHELQTPVSVSDSPVSVTVRLERPLRPAHDSGTSALSWSEY